MDNPTISFYGNRESLFYGELVTLCVTFPKAFISKFASFDGIDAQFTTKRGTLFLPHQYSCPVDNVPWQTNSRFNEHGGE